MGSLKSVATVGLNTAMGYGQERRERRALLNAAEAENRDMRATFAERQAERARDTEADLASARARAGAFGVGGSVSSRALLQGIANDAAREERDDAAALQRRIAETRRATRAKPRNSLLESAARGVLSRL